MAQETINIVNLIEKDTSIRLNRSYKSSLITKIQNNFNADEQQLFVASFYCYLNYDPKKEFVIDFTNMWKWCGFTRKGHAKTLLEKYFIEDVDYKISFDVKIGAKSAPEVAGAEAIIQEEKSASAVAEAVINNKARGAKPIGAAINKNENFAPPIGGKPIGAAIIQEEKAAAPIGAAGINKNEKIKNKGGAGLNKENITLTVNCFKKLCLKAGTKKADEIHDYYIKLEELLQETLKEQSDELQLQLNQQQLQLNQKENENKKQQLHIKHLENRILNKQKRTHTSVENVIYIVQDIHHKKERLHVIGKAVKLADRLSSYNKCHEHEVIYYKACKNRLDMHVIELMVLRKLHNYREQANRDRFILPKDKDISLFTKVIDDAVKWFEDSEESKEDNEDFEEEDNVEEESKEDNEEDFEEESKEEDIEEESKEDNKEESVDAIKKSEYQKEYHKQYQIDYQEELHDKKRQYYEEHKEATLETNRKYKAANPEKIKEIYVARKESGARLEYDRNHKEQIRGYCKKSYYKNHDKKLEIARKYREENLVTVRQKNLERNRQRVMCECGMEVSRGHVSRHVKSAAHLKVINNI